MSDSDQPAAEATASKASRKSKGGDLVTADALKAFMQAALSEIAAPKLAKAVVAAGLNAMAEKLVAQPAANGGTPGKTPGPKKQRQNVGKVLPHNILMAGTMHILKAEEEKKAADDRFPPKQLMSKAAERLKTLSDEDKQRLLSRYTPLVERLNSRSSEEMQAHKVNIHEEMLKFERENKLPAFSLGPQPPSKYGSAVKVCMLPVTTLCHSCWCAILLMVSIRLLVCGRRHQRLAASQQLVAACRVVLGSPVIVA